MFGSLCRSFSLKQHGRRWSVHAVSSSSASCFRVHKDFITPPSVRHHSSQPETTQRRQSSKNKPTTTMTTFGPQTFPLDTRTTFPYKLFRMLESCSSNDKPAITWLPHGRAFTIIDKDKFMAEIAPIYFSHTQFRSFLRQLGLWGFTR